MTASNAWEELKAKHPGVKLAEVLITQYCSNGNFYSLGEKYGVSNVCIRTNILKYKEEIIHEKPYMWSMYLYILGWNKRNTQLASKKAQGNLQVERIRSGKEHLIAKDKRESFTEKILEALPNDLEYTKFIDEVNKYDTGDLTGEYLARLAVKKGIKLYNYDLYTNRKRYIKF